MLPVLHRLGCVPKAAVWELTLQCDLRCQHCGSFAGASRPDELTLDELLNVAKQLADLGTERVTLSGGEPTLNPHWDEVARALSSRGVKVNLISNGWSWSPEHTRRAKAAGMVNAGFSLDGPEAAHDFVRARPGSYQHVVAAITECESNGFPTSVVSHVNRKNFADLESFHETLGLLGVRSWQIQIGTPIGNMALHRDLLIEPIDLLELIPRLAAMRARTSAQIDGKTVRLPRIHVADDVGYFGKYEEKLRDTGAKISFWIGCRAGFQVIGIESNGNIKGCLSLPSARQKVDNFVEGNVRKQSLREIWTGKDAFAFNRQYDVDKLEGFCKTCRFRDICRGGCSCAAYSLSGSRFNNPLCFYRVAMENGRPDLADDADDATELASPQPVAASPVEG